MDIRFDNQVAIVTGAGGGLGRSHALALAERGCKVVINDLGGSVEGNGSSASAAEKVVSEIEAAGGQAIANFADVTNEGQVAEMVEAALDTWGRVDILVNNAGILRDKSFGKMTLEDFRKVIDVHLVGSAACSMAAWPLMREQGYGRILFTSSPSGLFGIYGQANYGAAKSGMIGLMNALHLEGAKHNIRTNLLAPSAKTRMTEDLGIPAQMLDLMTPKSISAAALFLVSQDAPSRAIVSCTAGGYAQVHIGESKGIWLNENNQTPENLHKNWKQISDNQPLDFHSASMNSTTKFLAMAAKGQS